MLSSGVCLEISIQKDKVACWHGDSGRVRVWVCEVGRTTDIRNVGYVLNREGEKEVYTRWEQ